MSESFDSACPLIRIAAITTGLPALPFPVACFLIVPTGTPEYGTALDSHHLVRVARKPPYVCAAVTPACLRTSSKYTAPSPSCASASSHRSNLR